MNLSIFGESVVLKPRYSPPLGTRKIYNSTFFRNEEYHHEIANHYRDFKRRSRIHHRRRHNAYIRYKNSILYKPSRLNPFEYRDELPMAVKDFPRFAVVYTPPRGRQCHCESQPPDETYNDSVRRIRAARSFEELRAFVQRNYGCLAKRAKNYHKQKIRQGKYEKNETLLDKSETDSKQQATKQQRQRRSLGNLQSVVTACGKQKTNFSNVSDSRDKATIASTKRYLQLASKHYESEYLANVKYLESIPERNALIRYRSNNNNQTAKLTASSENNWNYSRIGSAKSNASNSSSNTDETNTISTCEFNYEIENLLRLIGRKRSFRIGEKYSPTYETVRGKIKNWAIRVNITPATGQSTCTPEILTTEQIHSRKDGNIDFADSMHDFLNSNTRKSTQFLETTTFNNNNNNINSTNDLVPNGDWSTEHLHNIIENLKHLDLNAFSTGQGLIPRITLSDYCDLAKNQYFEGQIPLDLNNIDNQALTSAQSACNSTSLLKSTKFVYKPNLDIPSEINYQSEARPP